MDRTGADAFVFSKACGLYARSFIGPRARKLFGTKKLPELWTLLFDEEVPLVPEGLLALLVERKAGERNASRFRELVSSYERPDPVSLALIRLYDYQNLKAVSSALALGSADPPFMIDIGEFSILRKDRWPDIADMTRHGPLRWYDRVPADRERLEWELRLDRDYYRSLRAALEALGAGDRACAEPLIREEIILQNIVWAMRLMVYYDMKGDDIIPLLACSANLGCREDPLVRPAIAILGKPRDSWNEWSAWQYAWLLNPHEEGVPWTLDPRWAQLAAERYLSRLALRQFHQTPFTPGVLVSFFRILQLEQQMIRIASEGIRLGASEGQMREFMGDVQNV